MKISILLSSFLIRFAVVEAFAFHSSSSRSRSSSSRAIHHRCYHHLGDLEHDALPGNAGDNEGGVFNTVTEVALDDTANPREAATKFVMGLSVALALVVFGGGGGSTLSLFQPQPAFAFDFDTTMVLSAGSAVKDSDIVDFSMPSYQDAARAEVNSNLKGEKYLLGEASKDFVTAGKVEEKSSSGSAPAAPIVDEKAQKAEAKAALKAARAKQQAEIDSNIKAKSEAAAAEAAAPPPATESEASPAEAAPASD